MSTPFIFRITAEQILYDVNFLAKAYAGKDDGDGVHEPGEGRGDPSMVKVSEVGPIPPGVYRIRGAERHPTAGNWVMRLEPLPGTETFGRSGFLIHGDSIARPGTGSKGCIVTGLSTRIFIAGKVAVGQDTLEVQP